jgi:hypothetical protein
LPALLGGHTLTKKKNKYFSFLSSFRQHLRLLRWLIPVALVLLVSAYELGPSRWVYETYGFTSHLIIEILLFAAVGPILAFVTLDLFWRWLDERDTSDLQAQLLSEARQDAKKSRQLADDALQANYASGVLITALKSETQPLSPKTISQIDAAEVSLQETTQRIRTHLLS